jgi:uncharacterized protein YrrD
MNHRQARGLAVFGAADGRRIGTVDGAFLDPAAKRVVGFSISGGERGRTPGARRTIDSAEVQDLGSGGLTIDDATAHGAGTNAAYLSLVPLEDLAKRTVVTQGGAYVGRVVTVAFDVRTFRLTQVEVSPGFLRGRKLLPADRLVRIGRDLLVVADAVPTRDDAGATLANAAGD